MIDSPHLAIPGKKLKLSNRRTDDTDSFKDKDDAAPLDDQLYRVHIEHGGASPEVRLDRATGTLRISQRVDWFMGARRLHVDARLTDAVPWEVICSTGAIRGDFDLSSARLTGFGCRTGASTVHLTLGAPQGIVPLRVEGSADSCSAGPSVAVRSHHRD